MSRSLQTVMFTVILAVGSVATMVNMSASNMSVFEWSEITDTRLAQRIDLATASDVPHFPALEGLLDGLRYRVLGDTGSQVRAGCPGWLFLAEEVKEVPHGDDNLRQRIRIAARVAEAFRSRGVGLIVVPVPDKVTEASAATCGAAISSQAVDRLSLWHDGTDSLSLKQIDAAAHWPRPGFWRTDTHWDRTGSRYVADLVAAAAGNILADNDHQPVRLKPASAPHPRPGDLLPLAGLDHSPAWLAPAADMEIDETAEITRSGGLLDTRAGAPVILAGTSYSLNSGFIDYLELALQSEVLQRSQLGGGFSGAILDLLGPDSALLGPAKLVIWEWPERALTLPLSEAEEAYLKSSP